MKNIILTFIVLTFPSIVWGAPADSKSAPRIMVHEIDDRSASDQGSCGFYGLWATPGRAVRELLVDELSKLEGVTVLEREHLSDLYGELTHENFDESTKVEKKKFIAANLAIAGVISEFEWCMSGGKHGLNIGGLLGIGDLSVGKQSSTAHVALQLRLIDVSTGKILKTFRTSGEVDDSGFTLSADVEGVTYDRKSFARTPLGKANRIAVSKAMEEIEAALKERR